MKRLYAITPIPKNTALASVCPHSIRSILNPFEGRTSQREGIWDVVELVDIFDRSDHFGAFQNDEKETDRKLTNSSTLPRFHQNYRAEILPSLEMVDYVALFDEETPYELIKSLQPDILVKGGDWKKEDIVGSDIAKETLSLPYIKGISTTKVIDRIKRL